MSLVLLCSCSDNTKVKKTKEITNKITQQSVILETEIATEEQYVDFFKSFSPSFIIPGLFEGIIPQGCCYDSVGDRFIISGYYEDSKFPSMIMLVNASDNKFIGAYPLKNTLGEDYYGHAGGIAVSENTIYITSDSVCYTFPLSKLNELTNGAYIQFESKFKLNTKGSFACIYNSTLWIGDFIESDDEARESAERITTLDSGETFYAYCEGYNLIDGLPSTEMINSTSDGYIPDYFLAIPEQVQGMALTKTNKIIFSTSYGRKNNSVIYIFDDIFSENKVGTVTIDGHDIDLLACSNSKLNKKIIAPPMAEGLANHPDGIYLIFESGAAKYRNGGGKFPTENAFVITIE
jgi:hypothetical protein